MYGSCTKQATVNKLTITKYTLRGIRHILILTEEYLLYKQLVSHNLHYAAAPSGRCQSLLKVRHAARHCHRFGMWCVRCHRFMSQVWHVVRQMSQVYVMGLACGASDVTGLCHRFGMWCVRCNRFGMCHGVCASDVMASVRQMSCHVMLKLLLQTFVVWRLWSSVYKNFS